MYAIKIDAVIPEDRRLIVDLPANVPVGLAEVIILSGGEEVTGDSASVLHYLQERQSSPEHHRAPDELERQIHEERAAWT